MSYFLHVFCIIVDGVPFLLLHVLTSEGSIGHFDYCDVVMEKVVRNTNPEEKVDRGFNSS